MTTHEAARYASEQYAKQIGHCPLFLFENPKTFDLAVGVLCPRGFVLAITEPLPKASMADISRFIADELD